MMVWALFFSVWVTEIAFVLLWAAAVGLAENAMSHLSSPQKLL